MPLSEPIRLSDYEELIREVLASDGEFRLYPHGTSMLPLIRQGIDSVALRQLDRPPRKYDILFYKRADGSFVLHRVKAVTPTGLTIWGDNQYRLEHGVTDDQIIGYEFIHFGKMMDMVKAGMSADEAMKKATGKYGRFDDAAKVIDPRKE